MTASLNPDAGDCKLCPVPKKTLSFNHLRTHRRWSRERTGGSGVRWRKKSPRPLIRSARTWPTTLAWKTRKAPPAGSPRWAHLRLRKIILPSYNLSMLSEFSVIKLDYWWSEKFPFILLEKKESCAGASNASRPRARPPTPPQPRTPGGQKTPPGGLGWPPRLQMGCRSGSCGQKASVLKAWYVL